MHEQVSAASGRRGGGLHTGPVLTVVLPRVAEHGAQVAATENVWVGHGQCLDHYGAGEAYLPLLEALGRLGRGPEG